MMTAGKDYLSSQGARAFATRLRRLFEALNRGASEAYGKAGVDFEPRWYGLLTLLCHNDRLEIGAAAEALGQSHVAVVQVANALESRGLIRRLASKTDRRSRTLEITPKGRGLCAKLAPLWDAIAAATQGLLKEAAPHFLNELDALEDALARRPLTDRITARSRS